MVSDQNPMAMAWTTAKVCILTFVALVGLLIVLTSVAYFPANFSSEFLRGRESYFYSWYAVAFYVHIISSPVALFIGIVQSVARVRNRFPGFHRALGYAYVMLVIGFATPSGLVMSIKAVGGNVSVVGFATLAVATAFTTLKGFNAAQRGQFASHRRWMTRSYLLICSAVMLRFLAALVSHFRLGISYAVLAWLSWLPWLLIYEVILKLSLYRARDSRPKLELRRGPRSGPNPET